MAGGPDLFVVCKNCQAEVSPYITECPYCGHRLRKRAPKLDKGAVPRPPRASRRRPPRPRLPPLRAGELPGVRGDRRPYATMTLVVASVLATLAAKALWIDPLDLIVGPPTDVWRRTLTAPFVYVSTGYEVLALSSIFLFGWLLERRHGPLVPLLVFVLAGAGGMWVADTLDHGTVATGGNGAALGLLGAWVVRDLLARRRGDEVDSDGLGVLVIAVLLVLLPAAVEEAHPLAGAAGGLIGLILGVPLARIRER